VLFAQSSKGKGKSFTPYNKTNNLPSTSGQRKKFTGKCNYCGKPNHKEKDCRNKKHDEEAKHKKPEETKAHLAQDGGDNEYCFMAEEEYVDKGWIVDSGAESSICMESQCFFCLSQDHEPGDSWCRRHYTSHWKRRYPSLVSLTRWAN
jgi:hypothetical protein